MWVYRPQDVDLYSGMSDVLADEKEDEEEEERKREARKRRNEAREQQQVADAERGAPIRKVVWACRTGARKAVGWVRILWE